VGMILGRYEPIRFTHTNNTQRYSQVS